VGEYEQGSSVAVAGEAIRQQLAATAGKNHHCQHAWFRAHPGGHSQELPVLFAERSGAVGFNPNDEHALLRPFESGEAVFALRNDLGTPATSEPYVLLKFQAPAQSDRWRFRIFRVLAEESPFFFQYTATAGTPLQPPFPLSSLQTATNSFGVSGPFFRDRKAGFWSMAAGNDGGPTNIVMRFFYKAQPGFFFPGPNPPPLGSEVPWLDLNAGTPGTPQNIGYTVSWPVSVPQLQLGETLVKPKNGFARRGRHAQRGDYLSAIARPRHGRKCEADGSHAHSSGQSGPTAQ
jgi:hypothetical protein